MPHGTPSLPAQVLRSIQAPKFHDAQKAADKEARRLVRVAYAAGNTVPFSLSRLVELKVSLNVVRAVYRPAVARTGAAAS